MATADCTRIWVRVNSVISVATSTSEIWASAAWVFSAWMVRLVMVLDRRFCRVTSPHELYHSLC